MTGVYQFLTTNQVSAQFLMSNADFFNTFFGWLGAEVTQFDDYPSAPQEVVTSDMGVSYNGTDLGLQWSSGLPYSGLDEFLASDKANHAIRPGESLSMFGSDYWTAYGLSYFGNSINIQYPYANTTGDQPIVEPKIVYWASTGKFSVTGVTPVGMTYYTDSGKWAGPSNGGPQTYIHMNPAYDFTVCYSLDGNSRDICRWHANTQSWEYLRDGVSAASPGTVSPGEFSPQIIGADAQYDDAGNITDYGNVSVPDVTAPDYQSPGSWVDALAQMQATATTDQHATAESPVYGQEGTTVKDWTEANKPTDIPKPSEGSQDDFKIEDLETVFPFCIPWDVYYLMSALSADPVAPAIDFPLNFSNFGLDDYRLSVDFAEYESFAVALRAIEVLGFCVGLALVTRNLIRG